MQDTLTILETLGPLLTKTFCADGSVVPYGDAASFKVKPVDISGWDDLRELLGSLHKNPKRCLIRGKFVGKDQAQAGSKAGTYTRTNANFTDQPLHWFMADVDGFEPGFADPVKQPDLAIEEYIEAILPPAFLNCSYYWHLSSSAGAPGKAHILKAHIHFISKTPYTTAQMHAWAKTIGKQIDSAVYRRVQVHYTADPIFEEGREDPVPVRCGFHQGADDFVDLQIGESILETARDTGAGEGGNDQKLLDPSEKDGIIGLFHRTFSAEQVLLELLEGFEQISERRYTWFGGGGTPEGVWVHDDGMHVGSSHNTWPIDGISNLWDLVRVFKFGDLDRDEDDFVQLDIDSRPINAKPSNLAMLEWAGKMPELQDAVRGERMAEFSRWQAEITASPDAFTLEATVAPRIREAELSQTERELLAIAYNARLAQVAAKLPIGQVRHLLQPRRDTTIASAPNWAKYWVWVSEGDGFMHIETKHLISERSYNARYDRYMAQFADENGNVPRASDMALKVWDTKVVDRSMYSPKNDTLFTEGGLRMVNTYRADVAPEIPESFTQKDIEAISVFERHASLLIPNDRERTLFLDYLAYCVKNPGSKIRWAPLLKGVEGDGKSAFVNVMQHMLGYQNVRVLDSSTLESSDFTAWRVGQCFTGVEEMKLHGHNRYDVYNKLKTPLSNDSVEVHCKGKDPRTEPNTTNYLLLTNYDDGMPINDNDRRIMVLRSPFIKKEDLYAVIGMDTTTYFDRLFDFAIKEHAPALRKWFMERDLSPEFKAEGRAPDSTARAMVVDMSRRDDDDAIASLLEDGGFGIYPNLIALSCLNDALFNQYNIKLNTGRAKATLATYGFQMWSDKQVKWNGKNYRFYYRGERPSQPALLATQLEQERSSAALEDDFAS